MMGIIPRGKEKGIFLKGNLKWLSLPSYLGKARGFVTTEDILSSFKNTEAHKEFVFDQADYQQTLESINHLIYL